MKTFEPIAGVTLEKYAKLCALMSKTQPEETEKHTQIAAENGVSSANWETAKESWTKMMTNPTEAMAVQQIFMPEYQKTLEGMSNGIAPITLEKYAKIKTALIFEKDNQGNKKTAEEVLRQFGYKTTEWSTIEVYWTSRVAKDEHNRVADNYKEEYGKKFNALMNEFAQLYNN